MIGLHPSHSSLHRPGMEPAGASGGCTGGTGGREEEVTAGEAMGAMIGWTGGPDVNGWKAPQKAASCPGCTHRGHRAAHPPVLRVGPVSPRRALQQRPQLRGLEARGRRVAAAHHKRFNAGVAAALGLGNCRGKQGGAQMGGQGREGGRAQAHSSRHASPQPLNHPLPLSHPHPRTPHPPVTSGKKILSWE